MQSLRLALTIMHSKKQVIKLKPIDIDVKFSRNKNDNLQSKVQAGSVLYGMNVDKNDIASAMDITTDIAEFVRRWELAEKVAEEKKKQNDPKPGDPKPGDPKPQS
jgi:hypothetical protein